VRRRAIDHHLECLDVMRETGSTELKIWLADGTNYAGQDSIRARQDHLAESLQEIYLGLREGERLVLEYKFFEPAFYHTDVPDWGTSLLHCLALGERAQVVLDTGHHAPGTNIEFIVAQLLRQNRLGAFDFNSRNYADDDLIVGAADPFQLFRILFEIVQQDAHRPAAGVNFMLDQCHNLESKIQGQIRSVMNVQESLAKALLVDREALADAQERHDVLEAHGILMDAFWTDVRPALAALREEQGLPADPFAAFRGSGYEERVAAERVGGNQMGWGA
jgi:L-rhamnose isomerase/sugar isomerase